MEIKVLGPGCAKCKKTIELVNEAVKDCGAQATVAKVTDMMEIAGFGVFATPAVVVDGTVKCSGRVPKKDEIKAWIS
ncbi:MAG: thioredoxin family protein [Thermodesulfobacteriota bacterium]